jgi:hypothetical protein
MTPFCSGSDTTFTPNKGKISTVSGSPVKPRRDLSKADRDFKKVYSIQVNEPTYIQKEVVSTSNPGSWSE